MRILIASDKFKGSLTAVEANKAIAQGLEEAAPLQNIVTIPIADGGDGLVATLIGATGGTTETLTVSGPLDAPTEAVIGFLPDKKTAIIEMAEASGIALLRPEALNPNLASTFGTGELIRHAISKEISKIILGIGGSATNDGGTGMARALGFQFLNSDSAAVESLPEDLLEVRSIVPPRGITLPEILVACDVTNPLLGPNGCTQVYGPQKGIAATEFATHEARLSHLVNLCGDRGRESAAIPGSGAAGGMGFGSLVFLEGKLTPGFELVAELLDLENEVKKADFIFTGEGSLDRQSLQGKGPGGLARLAKRWKKPIVAFCGRADKMDSSELFRDIIEISDSALTLEENMTRAAELLTKKAAEFALGNFAEA